MAMAMAIIMITHHVTSYHGEIYRLHFTFHHTQAHTRQDILVFTFHYCFSKFDLALAPVMLHLHLKKYCKIIRTLSSHLLLLTCKNIPFNFAILLLQIEPERFYFMFKYSVVFNLCFV